MNTTQFIHIQRNNRGSVDLLLYSKSFTKRKNPKDFLLVCNNNNFNLYSTFFTQGHTEKDERKEKKRTELYLNDSPACFL